MTSRRARPRPAIPRPRAAPDARRSTDQAASLCRLVHTGFPSGRLTSSNEGTWVLSHQASSTAPQSSPDAPPVWATKNFSSVRLYSTPQLHRTIAVILRICAYGRPIQTGIVPLSDGFTRIWGSSWIGSRLLTGAVLLGTASPRVKQLGQIDSLPGFQPNTR